MIFANGLLETGFLGIALDGKKEHRLPSMMMAMLLLVQALIEIFEDNKSGGD
jgi:hypothetical protein